MDKNYTALKEAAPWLIVAFAFFMQYQVFVTPAQLEQKHREIMQDVQANFTTKEQSNDLKAEISSMRLKIDKMYEIMTSKR